MSDRFIIAWAASWLAVFAMLFIFGFKEIPRLFGYNTFVAILFGVGMVCIIFAPIIVDLIKGDKP